MLIQQKITKKEADNNNNNNNSKRESLRSRNRDLLSSGKKDFEGWYEKWIG